MACSLRMDTSIAESNLTADQKAGNVRLDRTLPDKSRIPGGRKRTHTYTHIYTHK